MAHFLKSYCGGLAHPDAVLSYVEAIPTPKWSSMFIFYTTYLSIVFGMRKFMKLRLPPNGVAMVFRIHDLIGCVANLVLALLLGMEAWSICNRLSPYAAICAEEAFTPVSAHNNTCLGESHPRYSRYSNVASSSTCILDVSNSWTPCF